MPITLASDRLEDLITSVLFLTATLLSHFKAQQSQRNLMLWSIDAPHFEAADSSHFRTVLKTKCSHSSFPQQKLRVRLLVYALFE